MILQSLDRFKGYWIHRVWLFPSVLWWRDAIHHCIKQPKQAWQMAFHNLKMSTASLVVWPTNQVHPLTKAYSEFMSVHAECACKHAWDVATITDNLVWMLEAGVQLWGRLVGLSSSRGWLKVKVTVTGLVHALKLETINMQHTHTPKTCSIQIYLYSHLGGI